MFLLIFRYVFGGAIQTGGVSYVDFLVPGFRRHRRAVRRDGAPPASPRTSTAASSTGCARCRSLAPAVLLGRSLADTALIALGRCSSRSVIGFAVGFRIHGGRSARRCSRFVLVRRVRLRVHAGCSSSSGLVAGNAQAAQGMSLLVFPLIVRVERLRAGRDRCPAGCSRSPAPADHGDGRRGAVAGAGGDAEALLGHTTAWFVVRALLWSAVILAVFATLSTRKFTKL